jgi:hypothetical protein
MSLIKIAEQFNLEIDFRTPLISVGRGGPRKRYVIFYKDKLLSLHISKYFGNHQYAPSEKIIKPGAKGKPKIHRRLVRFLKSYRKQK